MLTNTAMVFLESCNCVKDCKQKSAENDLRLFSDLNWLLLG